MRKAAFSGGNVRLKSGEHPAAVPTAVGVQKTEAWLGPLKQNYCLKRDLHCLPWAMHMQTGLPWPTSAPSWPKGHGALRRCVKSYDCASKWYNEKQRGTILGSKSTSLAPCHMVYITPPDR